MVGLVEVRYVKESTARAKIYFQYLQSKFLAGAMIGTSEPRFLFKNDHHAGGIHCIQMCEQGSRRAASRQAQG